MMVPSIHLRMVFTVLLGLLMLFVIGACADSGDYQSPVSPVMTNWSAGDAMSGSGHQLWGYWEGYIPDTHDSLEFVPIRGTMIHLNARRFLEVDPCTDCLSLVNLEIDQGTQTLTAEIQITHPYPGLGKFTGFDVRAVVISDGSLYFPGLDATVPNVDSGDFTLIEPDGYTRLWNTLEFPEGSGAFKILEYSRGNLASPGDFTGTVNPFIWYGQYPRNHFWAGESMTREFVFKMVTTGTIKFGYAIDASWEQPTVDPPVYFSHFPSSANALEPYFSNWVVTTVLEDIQGSEGAGTVLLFDRQGWTTVQQAYLECPDLWTGVIEADSIDYEDSSTYGDELSASFTFTNEFGASEGEYYALLKVVDSVQDYWLGDINHTYQLISIEVVESQFPQFDGRIVFSAPNITQPPLPPTGNCWFYDFDTGVETQITNFGGVGIIWHEPRISPDGTLMMITMGPTPTSGNAVIYEIDGTDSWSCSSDACDNWNDFHPDGEHILVASGPQWDDTPELYSMNLDGTDRTLITVAPETIRNPRWSPDGTKIALVLGHYWDPITAQLWIYDVVADEFTHIMAADGMVDHPSWTPVPVDGHYLLAFDTNRDHHPDYETDIYIVNPETEEVLCHYDTGVSETHPSFSPDGLSFVFYMMEEDQEDSDLYIYSWKTGELVQLTDDDSYDGSPSWGWDW